PLVREDRPLDKVTLVAMGSPEIAEAIGREIAATGSPAALLSGATLLDPEALRNAVTEIRAFQGPIGALVYVGGIGTGAMPDTLADWRQACQVDAKALFVLLQACAPDLQESKGRVLSLSAMGGGFGRRPSPWHSLPSAGAPSGLLKTAAIEWPDVRFRVIDFAEPDADLVGQAVAGELLAADMATEIGYFDGARQVYFEYSAPQPGDEKPRLEAGPDWVLLVTGGARGITAEVLLGVLKPGMTVHLIGRAEEPEAEAGWSLGVPAEKLKKIIIDRMKAVGETLTPALVEKAISAVLRDREIRDNLESFRSRGATVVYHSADVRDEAQMRGILDGIYGRHNRIDMVIHGAGVIEDKLLVDKTMESFDRVFDTKADSTYLLSRLLRPESLRCLALFASVAGRTGNRGQCDYAAANELVNRFGWWFRAHWPHVRVSSINWGPWESGMASAEVNRQFRERGVIPIPPKQGREFFRREIFCCPPGEEEIVAGIFLKPVSAARPPAWPLLPTATIRHEEDQVTAEWQLSVGDVPALDDHRIDGKAIVPWACALEFMAQTVQSTWPDWHVIEALNHQQLRGITVEEDGRFPLRVTAKAREEDGALLVSAMAFEIGSPPRPCYRSEFRLLREPPDAPFAPSVPKCAPASVTPRVFYTEYAFHGPGFRLLELIDGLDASGLDAAIRPTGIWRDAPWVFHPGLMDMALQAGSFWAQWQLRSFGLPTKAVRIVRYGPHRFGTGGLRLAARVTETTNQTITFDFFIA
ncbi:MAG TPA: SDR family NAD(P)-dependent oxidoreductase, partial [Chthoniobacterales bacterium]